MGIASLSEGFAKPLGGFRNDKPRSSLDDKNSPSFTEALLQSNLNIGIQMSPDLKDTDEKSMENLG